GIIAGLAVSHIFCVSLRLLSLSWYVSGRADLLNMARNVSLPVYLSIADRLASATRQPPKGGCLKTVWRHLGSLHRAGNVPLGMAGLGESTSREQTRIPLTSYPSVAGGGVPWCARARAHRRNELCRARAFLRHSHSRL